MLSASLIAAVTCPTTMQYGMCVSSCQRRCSALSSSQHCGRECEEGCVCPLGLFYDQQTHACVHRSGGLRGGVCNNSRKSMCNIEHPHPPGGWRPWQYGRCYIVTAPYQTVELDWNGTFWEFSLPFRLLCHGSHTAYLLVTVPRFYIPMQHYLLCDRVTSRKWPWNPLFSPT